MDVPQCGLFLRQLWELTVGSNGWSFKLPYFAATAWYHKMLPADLQSKDLNDMLPEVENLP
jgi:hypothetical protein